MDRGFRRGQCENESETEGAAETSGSSEGQEHETFAKETCRQGAEPVKERSHKGCTWQGCRGAASLALGVYIMPP